MTPPTLTTSTRLAPAVFAALLAACGEDPVSTATEASSASTGNTDPSGTEPTTQSSDSNTDGTPTTAGTMTMGGTDTGSETGPATTTNTSTTSVATSDSETSDETTPDTTNETTNTSTNPIDTDTDTTAGPDPDTTSTSDTSTTDDPDTTDGDTSTGEPIVPCECPMLEVPIDDGIFVLSDDAELWKFRPDDLSFQMLGNFVCEGKTSTFSMAVDRLGFAWVMFSDGTIYKVNVADPTVCMPSGYNTFQMGTNLFGMGFVSNSAVDQCDSLYGNTFSGGGFSEGPNQGKFLNLDPDTLLIQLLGNTSFNGAEVSGTGDGRVFMFGGVNPSKLVEVDRTNGAYIDVLPLVGLETTNGFAFSHFDGDFYIFTEGNGFNSKVTYVDYSDKDMNGVQEVMTVVPQAPIRIVGAGVSTCAPFAPS
jgi:hypothetical protein